MPTKAGTRNNTSNVADDKSSEAKITNAVLCGKCGQIKGSESCCADGQEACEKCSMHAGTMLCCVEIPEEFKGMDLCMKCGQVAGGEQFCAEGAENCEKCGMHMGAVLCCKLKKDEPDQ